MLSYCNATRCVDLDWVDLDAAHAQLSGGAGNVCQEDSREHSRQQLQSRRWASDECPCEPAFAEVSLRPHSYGIHARGDVATKGTESPVLNVEKRSKNDFWSRCSQESVISNPCCRFVPACVDKDSTARIENAVRSMASASKCDVFATSTMGVLGDLGSVWAPKPASVTLPREAPLLQKSLFLADCYDMYLSHHWAAGRWEKLLALVFFFNAVLALVSGLVLSLALMTIMRVERIVVRPSWSVVLEVEGIEHSVICFFWCTLAGFALSFTMLFFGHRIHAAATAALPCSGNHHCQQIFFDGILQVQASGKDPAKRCKEEVRSLPALLNVSDRLIILASTASLSRLWSVLELTVWCALGKRDIEIVPLLHAKTVAAWLIFNTCGGILRNVFIGNISVLFLSWLLHLPVYVGFVCTLHFSARELRNVDKHLRSFVFEQSRCTNKRYRAEILKMVDHLCLLPQKHGSRASFEAYVQTKVRSYVCGCINNQMQMRHSWILLASLPVLWTGVDLLAGMRGMPAMYQLGFLLTVLTEAFLLHPLCMNLAILTAVPAKPREPAEVKQPAWRCAMHCTWRSFAAGCTIWLIKLGGPLLHLAQYSLSPSAGLVCILTGVSLAGLGMLGTCRMTCCSDEARLPGSLEKLSQMPAAPVPGLARRTTMKVSTCSIKASADGLRAAAAELDSSSSSGGEAPDSGNHSSPPIDGEHAEQIMHIVIATRVSGVKVESPQM